MPTATPDETPEPLDTQPIDPIDLSPARSAKKSKAAPGSDVTAATKPAAASAAPSAAAEPANPPTKPLPVVVMQKPKKKRRVWPWIAALVVVALLVVGFFVADAAAKTYARDYIKQRIIAVLNLDPKTPVKVDIGSGSVLLQALSGHLNSVDVRVGTVTFGALTGAATVHAENVPLDQNAKVEKLAITYTVAEKDVSALASNLSGAKLESVELDAPEIVAKSSFTVFGFEIPVGIGLTPGASTGQITFKPTSIHVGNDTFTAEQLLNSGFGALAGQLLKQQSFCVAEFLPKALTVKDVDVVKKDLVLKIDGDGVALGGKDLSTLGTCKKQM